MRLLEISDIMGAAAVSFGIFLWLFIMAIGTIVYFLPTIVAVTLHRNNVVAIALINFFLGWSFIGWIVALVMALTKEPQAVHIVTVQQNTAYPPMGYPQAPQSYGATPSVPGSSIQTIEAPPATSAALRPIANPERPS